MSDPIDELGLSPGVAECLRKIRAEVEAAWREENEAQAAELAALRALRESVRNIRRSILPGRTSELDRLREELRLALKEADS